MEETLSQKRRWRAIEKDTWPQPPTFIDMYTYMHIHEHVYMHAHKVEKETRWTKGTKEERDLRIIMHIDKIEHYKQNFID